MTSKGPFLVLVTILASVSICQQGFFLPTAPTDVRVSDVTATSVRLSWSHGIDSEGVLYYVIKYKPKASSQGYSEIGSITSNTYVIRDLNPHTEYEFFIIPVNSKGHGIPSAPVVAKFEGEDLGRNPPTNIQARPLSTTCVVVQWNPPKDLIGQVVGNKVYYTTRLDLPVSEWNTQQAGNNHLTTISDLTPHTVYAIMIQAFTISGPGSHSIPVQVKTQRGVPGPPGKITVTEISTTTVAIYWSKPSHVGERITGYELYWNDSYTHQEYHKKLNDTDSHTISGLHPDTVYSVWVAAKSLRGNGAPTPAIHVRTDEYVPSKPRNVKTKTINTTAIAISWKPPSNKDRRGLIEGYHVYLGEMSSSLNSTSTPKQYYVASESADKYNVSGLQPDTQYSIQVAAVTRKGDGELSRPKIERTEGGVPSAPELRVRLTHDEAHFIVEITWFPPVFIKGNLRNYRLIFGRSDLYEKDQMLVQELDPRTVKQTIRHLNYGARYEFYLSARNDKGWGQEATESLTTPESAPDTPPQNFSHHLQSPGTVALSWLPPSLQYRNGEIVQYNVQSHKVSDNTMFEHNTSDTSMVVGGLAESTDYVFRVRAYTAKGGSPWSIPMGVTTPRYVLPAPTAVTAYSTSDESVEVSWDWDPAPYLLKALGFQVMYSTDFVEDLDQWSNKMIPFTSSTELRGLERYATYAIRVAVISGDGLGRLSDIVIVKVDPTDVPTDLRVSDITTDSMTISWKRPSKLDPFKYEISYDAYKEFYDGEGVLQRFLVPSYTIFVGAHITDYSLYDLVPFTSYHINVTAIAIDEQSRPPAKITATTAMAAPKLMAKPDIVGLGGEVSVVLPKASEEHGPIRHYYLAVVPEEYATRHPGEYSTGELGAVPSDKIGPYISAKFFYGSVPTHFPLGDGKTYGGYLNRRLHHNEGYRVFVRAFVDFPPKNLYTDSPFSDLISWDLPSPHEELTYINVDPGYDTGHLPDAVCPSSGNKRAGLTWVVYHAIVIISLIS